MKSDRTTSEATPDPRTQQDEEPGTQQHSQKPVEGDEQDIESDVHETQDGEDDTGR